MPEIVFVPKDQWDDLPVQPPSGRWLARMRPCLVGIIVSVSLGAVLGLVDAFAHYAFPVWIALVPLGAAIALAAVALPMSVLAMRPYYRERKLGYTTWPGAGS